ncbi:MAG: hypothetical protein LBP83_01715 [Dysgonamonadaceae bacterium]|jgi:hypothetical protein|nr:hypothetical protein [Dysgonamonadaceae bacterium]
MKTKINQIITALMELEAKGCHAVSFEYGNGLFKLSIFRGEVKAEKVVYEQTINLAIEQTELCEICRMIENLKSHVKKTVFQCYKREFVKGEKAGKWEKSGSSFEFGDNATSAMLIDHSGYYIDDPDNGLQYFVDYHSSETDK